jgi:hypothetical protein
MRRRTSVKRRKRRRSRRRSRRTSVTIQAH